MSNDARSMNFFDYLVKYLWADDKTISDVLPFLMLTNTFVILLLAAVLVSGLVWHFRSEPGHRFHPTVVRGFLWPFTVASLLWAFGHYPLQTFSQTAVSNVALLSLGELLGSLAALGVFVAGITLLRLPASIRAHAYLVAPPPDGSVVGQTKNRTATVALSSGAVLLIFSDWTLLLVANFKNDLGAATIARLIGSSFSCLSLVTLGLGLLRELNKFRVDPLARAAGWAMILYGSLQLFTVTAEDAVAVRTWLGFDLYLVDAAFGAMQHLTLGIYASGLLFKTILALTLFGFFVMVIESRHARLSSDEAWRRLVTNSAWVAGVMARHIEARHNLVSSIGLLRSIASRHTTGSGTSEADKEEWSSVEAIVDLQAECVRAFVGLDPLEVGGAFPKISSEKFVAVLSEVARDFQRDGAYDRVTVEDKLPTASLMIPVEEIKEMLHRILENGPREGARAATIQLSLDGDLMVILVKNDGRAFTPAARENAFLGRSGGAWVGRKIALDLGGDLDLVSRESDHPIFRIRIPSIPLGELSHVATQ